MRRFVLPALAITTAIAMMTATFAQAKAATFSLTYSGLEFDGDFTGNGIDYQVTVTTGDSQLVGGRSAFLVTGVSGTGNNRNGLGIIGIAAAGSYLDNDNYLYVDGELLSMGGIGFLLSDGGLANIGYLSSLDSYYDTASFASGDDSISVFGTLGVQLLDAGTPTSPPTASPVPEPATWTMMLVGFGAIGGGLRRASRSRFALGLV